MPICLCIKECMHSKYTDTSVYTPWYHAYPSKAIVHASSNPSKCLDLSARGDVLFLLQMYLNFLSTNVSGGKRSPSKYEPMISCMFMEVYGYRLQCTTPEIDMTRHAAVCISAQRRQLHTNTLSGIYTASMLQLCSTCITLTTRKTGYVGNFYQILTCIRAHREAIQNRYQNHFLV
jgi:hypothetical protein